MKIDVTNSGFLTFLDNTSNKVLSKINVKNYFELTDEQKLTFSYTVFSLIKSNLKVVLSDSDFKSLMTFLRKKHEVEENYEFASIINDIVKNFDNIVDLGNTKKPEIKKKKTENN